MKSTPTRSIESKICIEETLVKSPDLHKMQTISHDGYPRVSPGRPASIAPSISSVLSDATTITAPIHVQRGFKTREAYLAALDDFAESKLYMPAGDYTLHGWYGGETMNDRKKRLAVGKEKRRSSKHTQNADVTAATNRRRATIAAIQEATEDPAQASNSEEAGDRENSMPTIECAENSQSRLRRFSRVLSGRKERRTSSATVT